MALNLGDIIDLDFFLTLDETRDDREEEALSLREREIYSQIENKDLDDPGLIREWLSYRKLLFFHQSSSGETLPGLLFESLFKWSGKGLFFSGLILGLAAAYSFLAYHGSQPVNVTLFITFFMLIPALFSALGLGVLGLGLFRSGTGAPPFRFSFFQTLVSGLFFRKLGELYDRAGEFPGGESLKKIKDTGGLARSVNRNHKGLMFWPFFKLSSFFALGFSSGALGATLFRVTVADLAFGWQSTLLTSGVQVHELVSWMALPWAWALPEALPGLDQIQGSRMILKEGISGLATEDLQAWWPFLSMGILVYGVCFRLVLILGAVKAQAMALSRIDLTPPRYRRLLVRMRSPRMETRVRDTRVSQAKERAPLPRPENPAADDTEPPEIKAGSPPESLSAGEGLLFLASEQGFPEMVRDVMAGLVEDQLAIHINDSIGISFDLDQDRELLESAASGDGPVIILQEVWQPPIRGLLHYYTSIKTQVFSERPLWIFLTQTPEEGEPGVASSDVNYAVWQAAVAQLNDPDIILERMLP